MRFLFLEAIKKVVGGKWDTKEVCYHCGLQRALCAGKLKALKVI
jgi:hypothetical protein